MRHWPLTVLALTACCAAAITRAATNDLLLPAEIAFGPLPDAAQALSRAADATTNRFPDADTVLVEDLVRESYRPDGTSEAVDDEYTRILTEKGRHDGAMRSFYFEAAYGTVTVARAELIKPDGRRQPIDVAQNGRVMIDSGQMGANIYDPNNKIFQLSVPGLEIGDVCHFTVLRRTHKAQVPDTWADLNLLEDDAPIMRLTYEVAAPAARPLKHIHLRDPLSNTVVYAASTLPDGRTLHRWEARDVPQMFPEPEMPALHTVVQRLLLSTAPDWPTISRWYWNLCQPRLAAVTPEMRTTVSNLVAGAADDDERARRLFTFVSQDVRYLGLTFEEVAPGYEPHDVCTTFHDRAGVCRDKAALLVALLRLAGIDAFPVLISVGAKLDPDAPLPWFNHAIVGIAGQDGSYRLLDPTNESTRDPFPAYLCNRSYLVARPTGDPLRVSSVHPADQNLVRVETRGTLAADGALALDVRIAFDGINDTAYRSHFARQKPDERRRFFEGLLKARLPGAELTAIRIEPANPMDTTVPLTATLACRAKDCRVSGDGLTLLPLPWLGNAIGYVHRLLDGATLTSRRYPYVSEIACGVDETLAIALDRGALGAPLELPPDCSIRRSGVEFARHVGVTNGLLSGHLRELLTQPEFTPAEYADLKGSMRDIEYAARERPIFAAVNASQADTRMLSDDVRIDVTDTHTWSTTRTIVRQVLTYSGKKRNAELKLPFNPVWQTAEMLSATVSNRDGSVRTVGPRDMAVMDAPWVGGAPRYPAGQTRVVTLPGVEVGSVIRTVSRRTQQDAPFFAIEHPFGGSDPVDASSLEVVVPNTLALHMCTPNGERLRHFAVTNAASTLYRWSATAMPATPPEDDLPPWRVFRPTVLLSAGSWRDFARATDGAFDQAMRRQPAARARARQLVAGLHDDLDKLRAVRDDVAETIRTDGPGFLDLPLTSLSPADRTLADGYGHQADCALLLATMLRAAGFEATPVLVAPARHAVPSDFQPLWDAPQPALFGDVLVQVKLGGRPIYLGDTDQYAEPGATPHEGHPLLDEDGRLGRVSVDDAHATREESDWNIDLDSRGQARITVETRVFGSACAAFRKQFAEMPPEERRRHFQGLVAGVSQSARPIGDLVTDLAAYPGRCVFTVEADRYGVREGRTLTLLLPEAAVTPVNLRADQRTNPLFIDRDDRDAWSCRVVLPPGVTRVPVLPPAGTWRFPASLGTVTLATDRQSGPRDAITFRRDSQVGSALIPPETYPALLEIDRRLTHPQMQTVVMELE